LQRALELDPEYVEALNNLGHHYMLSGRPAEALAMFDHAIQLDPGTALLHANRSLALLTLQRPAEAEAAARKALALDPSLTGAQYALGLALASDVAKRQEALAQLRRVSALYARARLAVAHLLAQSGEPAQAEAELTLYLRSGQVEDRQKIEGWLEQLRGRK
jgi:tetratricopeptide (TPR) repeat protein